jgi:hypothetical protein
MTIEDVRKRHEAVKIARCVHGHDCPCNYNEITFLLATLDAIAAYTVVRPDEEFPLWVKKVHALATRGKEQP